jgi:hypothetical protein
VSRQGDRGEGAESRAPRHGDSRKSGEVPVAAIAAALDIVEIKEAPLKSELER